MKTRLEWLLEALRGRLGKYTMVRLKGLKEGLSGFIREVDDGGGVRMEARDPMRHETPESVSFFAEDVVYISGSVEEPTKNSDR